MLREVLREDLIKFFYEENLKEINHVKPGSNMNDFIETVCNHSNVVIASQYLFGFGRF